MQLQLDHLVPEPLKARLPGLASDVWNTTQVFREGERVLFRAPSGKGKSTFLHILYGLRHDYEGIAQWDQVTLGNAHAQQLADWRSGSISIVFQDLRLFNELTVEENLLLKNHLKQGVSTEQIRQWLAYLGLSGKWQQQAGTLSYGERQRVAIVRSLLQPFDWLLLDEPFSHLDHDNIERGVHLIRERLNERKAGLLLADLEDNDWFDYDRKLLL